MLTKAMTELQKSQRMSGQALTGDVMSYITDAELAEIVPDLRAMASIEVAAEVRAAMIRLADRYAALTPKCGGLIGAENAATGFDGCGSGDGQPARDLATAE